MHCERKDDTQSFLTQGYPMCKHNIVNPICLQSGHRTEARKSLKGFSEPEKVKTDWRMWSMMSTFCLNHQLFGLTPREMCSWWRQPGRQTILIKDVVITFTAFCSILRQYGQKRVSQFPMTDRRNPLLDNLEIIIQNTILTKCAQGICFSNW